MVNIRFVIRVLSHLHRILYQASGGWIGANIGVPVLLLTTVGHKSGRSRTTPLLYLEKGADWAIVGSNAGSDQHPSWWLNLKATPTATAQVRRARKRVHAREASEDEKRSLWPRFVEVYAPYQDYERRTTREFPVVILEPESRGGEAGRLSENIRKGLSR